MLLSLVLGAEEGHEGFEAPQKWFPGEKVISYELIWGGLAFLIVAAVLVKFAGPAIMKAMAARTEKVQNELDRSLAAKTAAEAEVAKVRADLANADTEAATIVAEARQVAEQLKVDGLARLEVELADTRSRALADIETARFRVAAELEGSVARLAIGAAERVVEANLDDDTQNALVEQFIANVGGMRP